MPTLDNKKSLVQRQIEELETTIDNLFVDLAIFLNQTDDYFREKGREEDWIYINRIKSLKYNNLICLLDAGVKRLQELRDSKRTYI